MKSKKPQPKHTPGPWTYSLSEEGHTIHLKERGEDGGIETQHQIEYRHGLDGGYEDQFEEAEANASLIAAAPELLEALKEIIKITNPGINEDGSIGGYTTSGLSPALENAIAAIKKATE